MADTPDAAHTPDAHRSSSGALTPALRRWPLLLVLAVAGGVVGFLGFSQQSPVYESSARLWVKKRIETTTGGDGRSVVMEDYVATITQIIQSDEVMRLAAVRAEAAKPADPTILRPDDYFEVRANQLKGALSISRVRDTNSPISLNSSVLGLRYPCGDPGEAQKTLDAIIHSVKLYLDKKYVATKDAQIKAMGSEIDALSAERKKLDDLYSARKTDLQQITTEELAIIRSRVSANRERSFALQLELIGIDRDLDAIKAASRDPLARAVKLKQLVGITPVAGPTPIETALAQLAGRRAELAERMGKDHPELKQVEGQIKYFEEQARKAGPTGIDELTLYEGRLIERRAAAAKQQEVVDARLTKDEDILRRGAVLDLGIGLLERQIGETKLQIDRREVERRALESVPTGGYEADEIDKPQVGRKVSPNLRWWVAPGVFLGLLLGVGLAYLAELSDQSFRNPAEIRRRLGAPVFGHMPTIRLDQPATADVSAAYDRSLVCALRPKSMEAELYRGVRTQVMVATANRGHTVIQVTSPNPGDGKSTTAANLAISLAQAGKRVALIDCDFRKPRVHALFALAKPEVGLASVVDGSTELDAAVRPSDVDNLSLLPCGPRPANPAELLSGERFAEVLKELKARFDYVVIDTPPLLAVSDPLVVAQRADAVLMVFGISRRSRPQVERAREQLADIGATLLGVVVNGVDGPGSGYASNQYSYAYNYEYQYADQYTDDKE